MRLVILIPVYNDWISLQKLLVEIDKLSLENVSDLSVLIIDDASTIKNCIDFSNWGFDNISSVRLVKLKRNLGHQRAIASGFCHIVASSEKGEIEFDGVLVMDGDGEDRPSDISKLVKASLEKKGSEIIFAERAKRSESFLFKVAYSLYKISHLILTGIPVKIGNFSILSKEFVVRLVIVSELWNHYAASVLKAKFPWSSIPIDRGSRYDGNSKMDFTSLVAHGFSAISVFSDRVGARIFSIVSILMSAFFVLFFLTLFFSLFFKFSFPLGVVNFSALFVVILFQLLILSIIFILITLRGRDSFNFIPIRDYLFFIESENFYS